MYRVVLLPIDRLILPYAPLCTRTGETSRLSRFDCTLPRSRRVLNDPFTVLALHRPDSNVSPSGAWSASSSPLLVSPRGSNHPRANNTKSNLPPNHPRAAFDPRHATSPPGPGSLLDSPYNSAGRSTTPSPTLRSKTFGKSFAVYHLGPYLHHLGPYLHPSCPWSFNHACG